MFRILASVNGKKLPWYKSPKVLRHAVMAFFFLFLAHVAIEHQTKGGGPRGTPSVEAYCPFGGLENLYQFITTGGFIHRIEPSAMILFFAVVVLTLVASRGFCGWICPFGSVQEWIGMLGRKLFRKHYNPTGAWDRALRYLKYVILLAIIALTWHTGSLVFRDYDPFLAFFHFGLGISELPWAYGLMGLVLIGSLYIERFFCKYACPLGAVLGILGKLGLTKIQRDDAGCKSCNLCYQKCHAHVDFLASTTIRSAECNQCMDCVADCPKPAVLSVRGPRWRFSHPGFAMVLVAGLFTFIGVSQLSGKWVTKPEEVKFTTTAGKLDPGAIRGWMTLKDISQGYGIPLGELYRGGKLPAAVSPDLRLNKIASTYNLDFEPESLREFVTAYVSGGKPETVEKPAAKQPRSPGGRKAAQPGAGKEHGKSEGQEIRGMMTLNEISLKTGVPKEYLLKAIGVTAAIDPRIPVRDWIHEQGKSVPDLRDAVQDYKAGKR